MTDVFEASRFYAPEPDGSLRGGGVVRSGSRDLLYLLHRAHEKYLRGEFTDLQYIAAINITLDADAQRQMRAQDSVAWDRYMVDKAQRAGLLDANGKPMARITRAAG